MKIALIVGAALVVGAALGYALNLRTVSRLRQRVKELRTDRKPASIIRSVTRFLFVTTQVCALGWVSVSYGVAVYATVVLMQPFPVEELSGEAIRTILGVTALKVIGNIFEHNEGPIFGRSKAESSDTEGEIDDG